MEQFSGSLFRRDSTCCLALDIVALMANISLRRSRAPAAQVERPRDEAKKDRPGASKWITRFRVVGLRRLATPLEVPLREEWRQSLCPCHSTPQPALHRVPQAFSDSADSDSGALGLNLGQLFWRHSATLIPNLHNDLIGLASDTDGCALTSSAMHAALSQRRWGNPPLQRTQGWGAPSPRREQLPSRSSDTELFAPQPKPNVTP
jgi:hypothetical protein